MSDDPTTNTTVSLNLPKQSIPWQRWSALAALVMPAAFIIAQWIYLTGKLGTAGGPFAYALADLLYGPVWGASLVLVFFTLHEQLKTQAPHRMRLALLAAVLAAAAMVLVACIRSANRQYHLTHPDLRLETSTAVLVVWSTLVAGVSGAGWHFLGWALALLGSAGWTTGHLPRALCVVYLAGALVSACVYQFPNLEPVAGMLSLLWSTWQGILFWKMRGRAARQPF